MNVVIVYDSMYGNTKKIAEAIKSGVAKDNQVTLLQANDANLPDLTEIDLLIVGSPVHGGRPSQTMQTFLQKLPALNGIKVAAFDTRMSVNDQNLFLKVLMNVIQYAAPRIMKSLLAKGGTQTLPGEGFIVEDKEGPLREGELERATKWASTL